MPKSNTEKSRELRARRTDAGLREVRGIWLKPRDHAGLKEFAADVQECYPEKAVRKALGLEWTGD